MKFVPRGPMTRYYVSIGSGNGLAVNSWRAITWTNGDCSRMHMGQVMEVRLSCYLVLLSNDSKTRLQDSRTSMTWPVCPQLQWVINCSLKKIIVNVICKMVTISFRPQCVNTIIDCEYVMKNTKIYIPAWQILLLKHPFLSSQFSLKNSFCHSSLTIIYPFAQLV